VGNSETYEANTPCISGTKLLRAVGPQRMTCEGYGRYVFVIRGVR